MTVAIKALLIGVFITFIGFIFPSNIITFLNIPILPLQNFIHSIAFLISQWCNFGDIFLMEGSTILMVKTLVFCIYCFGIYKIVFPVAKLILY